MNDSNPASFLRRSPLEEKSLSAHVDDLAHDGRGIAHREGKALFIAGALPGEEVSFQLTARRQAYDEGWVRHVIKSSPDRVEPQCPHFGICGGCSLQYLAADRQLAVKQDWLLDNMNRIAKVRFAQVLEPLTGLHWGYRRKARLGVKEVTKKGRVLVGFRERQSTYLADLRCCEVIHPRVGSLLEELAQMVADLSIRNRLPQIEVAVGDTAAALSFRVLSPPNENDQVRLRAFGERHDIQIYLQSGGYQTTALLWPEEATLSYRLPLPDLELEFKPHHFIQVNAEINKKMVARVISLLDLKKNDVVLDLFCGIGNFTLAMARYARWVTGVDTDHNLLSWAKRNAEHNGIDNVLFSAADLSQDVTGQPWLGQKYDKVLLDPPRSGALEILPLIASLKPRRVIYVSCHPATLARDAGQLVHCFGYQLVKTGVLDMFPHTTHVEALAVFEHA
jgi:23S rRNA (uracil1939-C5)-methyltransferase